MRKRGFTLIELLVVYCDNRDPDRSVVACGSAGSRSSTKNSVQEQFEATGIGAAQLPRHV